MSQFLVSHYSTLTSGKHEVLNVQGQVSPSEVSFLPSSRIIRDSSFKTHISYWFFLVWVKKHPGSLLEGFTKTQVSTLAVKDKFLVAGGFQGELLCKVNSNVLPIMDYTDMQSNQLFPHWFDAAS